MKYLLLSLFIIYSLNNLIEASKESKVNPIPLDAQAVVRTYVLPEPIKNFLNNKDKDSPKKQLTVVAPNYDATLDGGSLSFLFKKGKNNTVTQEVVPSKQIQNSQQFEGLDISQSLSKSAKSNTLTGSNLLVNPIENIL
ncbi:MAG: hypothetical protein ACXWL5_05015, partial [Candidatus Chromulinivorax sp.]